MWKGATDGEDGDERMIYIDSGTEQQEVVDEDHEYSQWNILPDLIIEKVYGYLDIKERYYAALVCENWAYMFKSPQVWRHFILDDTTLTRRKFNYFMGYQKVLDHLRTSIFLYRCGNHIRSILIRPMTNFFNMYEFMTMASQYAENSRGALSRIHTLRFTFSCHLAHETRDENVFGTGGEILRALKRLMDCLPSLLHLELNDLLLDNMDARHLLDQVCYTHCHQLRSLRLVNVTRRPCPLLHAGVFVNLRELWLSPVTLGEDVVTLVGASKVKDFIIYQDKHSEDAPPVRRRAWVQCSKNNPQLRVHLLIKGPSVARDHIWQPGAPVTSVLYDTPTSRVSAWSVMSVIEHYAKTLTLFGHLGHPRLQTPRRFNERCDSLLVLLCRGCLQLQTLIVRERISTCTLLLMADAAPNLINLYVRRNAVVLKNDWPQNPEWSPYFAAWLKANSRSYEATEREVGQRIGLRDWKMCSDSKFKSLEVDVRLQQ